MTAVGWAIDARRDRAAAGVAAMVATERQQERERVDSGAVMGVAEKVAAARHKGWGGGSKRASHHNGRMR